MKEKDVVSVLQQRCFEYNKKLNSSITADRWNEVFGTSVTEKGDDSE